MLIRTVFFTLALTAALPAMASGGTAAAGEIVCEGQYGGHLQGIAVDGKGAIFWSFTVDLVKTDSEGKVLARAGVPSHHGDLTWRDGKVYVAVNLGQFNQEAGKADSWVYVYDDADLSLLSKHEVQEVVHGAGGMAYHDGRFIVVGGLPEGYDVNYAYEYDLSFRFIRRHVIESGYTRLGIQTACYGGGYWWFGCYGHPENCALFRTDGEFAPAGYYDTPASVGFDMLPDGRFIQGFTGRDETTGKWWGKAAPITLDEVVGAVREEQ